MFSNLLHKTELSEVEQAQHEHLKGLFTTYDHEYKERRVRCASLLEEFVRKNQDDFVKIAKE